MNSLRMKLLRLSLATMALASALLVMPGKQAHAGALASPLNCCNDLGCCVNGEWACARYDLNGTPITCLAKWQ